MPTSQPEINGSDAQQSASRRHLSSSSPCTKYNIQTEAELTLNYQKLFDELITTSSALENTLAKDELSLLNSAKSDYETLARAWAQETKGVGSFVKLAFPELVECPADGTIGATFGQFPPTENNSTTMTVNANNNNNDDANSQVVMQSLDRTLHQSNFQRRVVFDLNNLADSEPPLLLDNDDELRIGEPVSPTDYELVLAPDINQRGTHFQWFYFEVSGIRSGVPYTFEIVNCAKSFSMFAKGMQPLLFSVIEAVRHRNPSWSRTGSSICYYRNLCPMPKLDSDRRSSSPIASSDNSGGGIVTVDSQIPLEQRRTRPVTRNGTAVTSPMVSSKESSCYYRNLCPMPKLDADRRSSSPIASSDNSGGGIVTVDSQIPLEQRRTRPVTRNGTAVTSPMVSSKESSSTKPSQRRRQTAEGNAPPKDAERPKDTKRRGGKKTAESTHKVVENGGGNAKNFNSDGGITVDSQIPSEQRRIRSKESSTKPSQRRRQTAEGNAPSIDAERPKEAKRKGSKKTMAATAESTPKVVENGGGNTKNFFTLRFTIQFLHDADVCYIAYHFPYTYSRLQATLERALSSCPPSPNIYVRRQRLASTLCSNVVPLLTVTASPLNVRSREFVLITARVHPGEANSSWIMQGVFNFLLSPHPLAVRARELFIFKLVPMLNPDGVINGSQRCSLSGRDLNRVDLIRKRPFAFVDLHGHSRKANVFMYGNNPEESWRQSDRDAAAGTSVPSYALLPQIFDELSDYFALKDCAFSISKAKEFSARVATWRQFNLERVYTMESTYCGFDQGAKTGRQIMMEDMKLVGVDLVNALVQLLEVQKQIIAE
uniref:Peptidase_M14 domain-containing protein n=1 Tax=Globodera pallida TaxID=36090 RepID=A0A183C1J9_GLOPA